MQYYKITSLADFNEFKEAILLHANPFQQFRLAGLVTAHNQRVTKTGKQFGICMIEDYTGNSEFALFGEDFVKFKDHFTPGAVVFITGTFKTRWNKDDDFEFKISQVLLLETVKRTMTKQLIVDIEPRFLTEAMVGFLEKNVKKNPGKSNLKFNLYEPKNNWKIGMYTVEKGFEMNDEMAAFLLDKPELNVTVIHP
jgi:DNA polymerase III subunit alpha